MPLNKEIGTWPKSFSEDEQERIIAAVERLMPEAALSGVCTNESIIRELGDLITTELKDMGSKCVNQQRGLWLNAMG